MEHGQTHITTSRLHHMYPHQAAADVGLLANYDAGELTHVASFVRANAGTWWRVHMFIARTGQTIYYTRTNTGEVYCSDEWGNLPN